MAPPLYNEIIEYDDGTPATQVKASPLCKSVFPFARASWPRTCAPTWCGPPALSMTWGRRWRSRWSCLVRLLSISSILILIQGFDDVWLPDGDQLLPEETQVEHDQVQEDRVHPQGLETRNSVLKKGPSDQVFSRQYWNHHNLFQTHFIGYTHNITAQWWWKPENVFDMTVGWFKLKVYAFDVIGFD